MDQDAFLSTAATYGVIIEGEMQSEVGAIVIHLFVFDAGGGGGFESGRGATDKYRRPSDGRRLASCRGKASSPQGQSPLLLEVSNA